MRIIGGTYRGLKLAAFAGEDIRPTADRVRESLFNILAPKMAGARALDLFCGSGSLGMECLSRGAAFVRFNDCSPASILVLKKNLARLKGGERYDVSRMDYTACLAAFRGAYDIIFIDPPYKSDCGTDALQRIGAAGLLSQGGVAVYERDKSFEKAIKGLRLFDERRYGRTYLSFFEREENLP